MLFGWLYDWFICGIGLLFLFFFLNISWFDLFGFENLRKFECLACMEIWVHGFFFFYNFFERKINNFLIL